MVRKGGGTRPELRSTANGSYPAECNDGDVEAMVSGSTGRERAMLSEIEKQFSAENPRLVRRLRAPGRFTRWRWRRARAVRWSALAAVLLAFATGLLLVLTW